MSTRIRRSAAVAAALVAVGAAGPASADPVAAPEVLDVPAELAADLSGAEEQSLSTLTAGAGVRVAALVDTGSGPQVVTFDAGSRSDASEAVRLLDAQPSVDAAEVPTPVRATATTYAQYGNALIRSAEARAVVDGPLSEVVVAVLDTGVAPHPELAAALLPGRNVTTAPGGVSDATDRHGHGTHVAGTIAADAGTEVEGVAHGARILPVKVLGDDGSGSTDWTAQGIIWAADNGADVINLSLGGYGASTLQAAAVDHARSRGVTVIAAAGNDNNSTPFYPAAATGVVAVSAVDQAGAKASFSNFGAYVDVAAPGVAITSTYPNPLHAGMSGTSMASPHVAGVAALVEAAAPSLTPGQVEQALFSSGSDLGAPGRDDVFGHGLVDAVRAVQAGNVLEAAGPPPLVTPVVTAPGVPGTPGAQPLAGSVRVTWAAPAQDGGAPVTGYQVVTYRNGVQVAVTTVAGSARSLVVGGLPNGVGHSFAVAAVNAAGAGPRAQTTQVTPRTVPGAPAAPGARPQSGSVRVTWAAPAQDGGSTVTAYQVSTFRGGAQVAVTTVPGSARSLVVGGLPNGVGHSFAVAAVNAAGIGPRAQTAGATPRTVPSAPRVGRADAARKAALVRWSAPASTGGAPVSGYDVQVLSGGRVLVVVPVGAGDRSLTVRGLVPHRSYAFRVVARNAAGAGPVSGASNAVRPRR